jgi:hypothetical protein
MSRSITKADLDAVCERLTGIENEPVRRLVARQLLTAVEAVLQAGDQAYRTYLNRTADKAPAQPVLSRVEWLEYLRVVVNEALETLHEQLAAEPDEAGGS